MVIHDHLRKLSNLIVLIPKVECMSSNQRIIRVTTRASDGSIRERDFESFEDIGELHDQIGVDDCSTDLELRGMPIFRGLVGPLPDGKTTVRYESPDVFEALTKEWANQKTKRRRRRKSSEVAAEKAKASGIIPPMNIKTTTNTTMPSAS